MDKTQIVVNQIAAQRNDALNAVATLVAELAECQEKIKELEKQLNEGKEKADASGDKSSGATSNSKSGS